MLNVRLTIWSDSEFKIGSLIKYPFLKGKSHTSYAWKSIKNYRYVHDHDVTDPFRLNDFVLYASKIVYFAPWRSYPLRLMDCKTYSFCPIKRDGICTLKWKIVYFQQAIDNFARMIVYFQSRLYIYSQDRYAQLGSYNLCQDRLF